MPDLPPTYRVEPEAEFADRLERVLVDQLTAPTSSRPTEVQRGATVSQIEITPSWTGDDPLNDVDPIVNDRPQARHRLATTIALGAAAAALLVVALTAVIRPNDGQVPTDVPSSTLDVPPTTQAVAPDPVTAGGMWPQSTLDEVRQAQVLADAGDPAYTWQVDPQLSSEEGWSHLMDPGAEIVHRFLREELGWEEFAFDEFGAFFGELDTSSPDGFQRGVTFLRCAAGAANPLYSAGADRPRGALCAPTIDELRYETVRIDLAQPDRMGQDGIWVVGGWHMTEPSKQADPRVVEADATTQLEEFLQARIDGEGVEGYVLADVPLLYTTTTGARYERFQIEQVGEPRWPFGGMDFIMRLFADDGATVVEQPISFDVSGFSETGGQPPTIDYEFFHSPSETTENGLPVSVSNELLNGTVSISAAAPWLTSSHFEAALAPDDQALERVALTFGPFQVSCRPIPAAADAATLAASVQADPDLAVTTPVDVTIGGIAGLQMDVALAPAASACPEGRTGNEPDPSDRIRGTGFPLELGSRMRLYLLDASDGSATRTLAIAAVAPEARFEAVLDTAVPIIDSIEYHPLVLALSGVLPEDLRDFMAEFGLAVEDASELADSFEIPETVEPQVSMERLNWSEDAEISVYLGRRTEGGGAVGTDQWPVGVTAWIVHATIPRASGQGFDRVVLGYDAETGESVAYIQS
jgi:hypothetical protein